MAVAPHVGAWIEIFFDMVWNAKRLVAPHVGAWIEIKSNPKCISFLRSPLTWGRGLK